MKTGTYRYAIEKLQHGWAYGGRPGSHLNSPARWRYVGTVVAKDAAEAINKASYRYGSSQVRISGSSEPEGLNT